MGFFSLEVFHTPHRLLVYPMFLLFTVTDTANVYVIENNLLGQWH